MADKSVSQKSVVRDFAHDVSVAYTRALSDAVHTEAAAAMVGVLTDRSANDASVEEIQGVFKHYLDCVDPHLRNEAARAGICAAVSFLSGAGVFPKALEAEVIAAFHALNDGQVKRIAVESPKKRRGAGTEYDRTARWFAAEVEIIKAVSTAKSDAKALLLLTGISRSPLEKTISKEWRFAPMPKGTSYKFLESMLKRGRDLLSHRSCAARRDVEIAIEAIKKGQPCPVEGFSETRAIMRATFDDTKSRTAWLRAIGATGGRKRRNNTEPDAPL